VPGEGFEPPTNGLQNRCSTPELTRLLLLYLQAFRYLHQFCQGAFATLLLPNSFGGEPLYGRLKCGVNKRDRIRLHIRQHVRVEIERDSHLAVP
jgi:hypothetical protein